MSVKTTPFSLNPGEERVFSVACAAGEKAISGGFTTQNVVISADTLPSSDGASWQIYLINLSTASGASGTAVAVCLK